MSSDGGNMTFRINWKGWNEVIRHIVDTRLTAAAIEIAGECNSKGRIDDGGYKAGTMGTLTLRARDYRATVITTNAEAIRDNAKHDRLINALDFGDI